MFMRPASVGSVRQESATSPSPGAGVTIRQSIDHGLVSRTSHERLEAPASRRDGGRTSAACRGKADPQSGAEAF